MRQPYWLQALSLSLPLALALTACQNTPAPAGQSPPATSPSPLVLNAPSGASPVPVASPAGESVAPTPQPAPLLTPAPAAPTGSLGLAGGGEAEGLPSLPGPLELRLLTRRSDTLALQWDAAGPDQRFAVYLDGVRVAENQSAHEYRFEALKPGRSYRLGVRAERGELHSGLIELTAETLPSSSAGGGGGGGGGGPTPPASPTPVPEPTPSQGPDLSTAAVEVHLATPNRKFLAEEVQLTLSNGSETQQRTLVAGTAGTSQVSFENVPAGDWSLVARDSSAETIQETSLTVAWGEVTQPVGTPEQPLILEGVLTPQTRMDFNGDGIDDLVIGSSHAKAQYNQAGKTYVIFGGASSAALIDLSTLNGSNGFVIEGAAQDDQSAYGVSIAGDVNRDGLDDLVIGAYAADPAGRSLAGAAYVVYGSTAPPARLNLGALNGSNGFTVQGAQAHDYTGWTVAGLGDLNQDGFSEIAIGAPNADANGQDSGATYVVYGGASLPAVLDLSSLSSSAGFRIAGARAYDQSGLSVSHGGDINGDGRADLVIGAANYDPTDAPSGGAAYVVYGGSTPANLGDLTASSGMAFYGSQSMQWLGFSAAGTGDVNGDGFGDWVIGAPTSGSSQGSAYVVYGGNALPASLRASDLNGSNGFALLGSSAEEQAGLAVSRAGDVNGDGLADVMVASPKLNTATVVFGAPVASASRLLSAIGSGGQQIQTGTAVNLGHMRLAGTGDLNNDGFDDVVVAQPGTSADGKEQNGSGFVIFGAATPALSFNTGQINGTNGFRVNGEAQYDRLGWSVD